MTTVTETPITQAEAARRLGVHPNTVANMLDDGRLKPIIVGTPGGLYRATRRVDEASLSRERADSCEPDTEVSRPDVPQHFRALAKANRIRRGHAALKREIAAGTLSVVEALSDPRARGHLPIAAVIGAQRRVGAMRTRQLLARLDIRETKPVEQLTERQRRLIREALRDEQTRCGLQSTTRR